MYARNGRKRKMKTTLFRFVSGASDAKRLMGIPDCEYVHNNRDSKQASKLSNHDLDKWE
jgi:hypothetical protein